MPSPSNICAWKEFGEASKRQGVYDENLLTVFPQFISSVSLVSISCLNTKNQI